MDIRVDFNVTAATGANKDKNFEQEVDDFIFGGFVDWVRRDETGCYVFIQDAWIPVVDWKKKYEFPGARDLTSLARYFYNLGQMNLIEKKLGWKKFNSEDETNGVAYRLYMSQEGFISPSLEDFWDESPSHYIDYFDLRELPKED